MENCSVEKWAIQQTDVNEFTFECVKKIPALCEGSKFMQVSFCGKDSMVLANSSATES